jgi:hypothetical protein
LNRRFKAFFLGWSKFIYWHLTLNPFLMVLFFYWEGM